MLTKSDSTVCGAGRISHFKGPPPCQATEPSLGCFDESAIATDYSPQNGGLTAQNGTHVARLAITAYSASCSLNWVDTWHPTVFRSAPLGGDVTVEETKGAHGDSGVSLKPLLIEKMTTLRCQFQTSIGRKDDDASMISHTTPPRQPVRTGGLLPPALLVYAPNPPVAPAGSHTTLTFHQEDYAARGIGRPLPTLSY